MKNQVRGNLYQKGLSALELLIVVPIVLLLIAAFARPALTAMGYGKSAEIQSHFNELRSGAIGYRSQRGSCTGVSINELVSRGFINEDWLTKVNPWGGSYTVGCAGSNLTQFQISTSGVSETNVGRQVAGALERTSVSSTFNSGSITIVVQG